MGPGGYIIRSRFDHAVRERPEEEPISPTDFSSWFLVNGEMLIAYCRGAKIRPRKVCTPDEARQIAARTNPTTNNQGVWRVRTVRMAHDTRAPWRTPTFCSPTRSSSKLHAEFLAGMRWDFLEAPLQGPHRILAIRALLIVPGELAVKRERDEIVSP